MLDIRAIRVNPDAIRDRLRYSNVPAPLRGTGIIMLITGVIAMTFLGFAGMMTLM